MQPAQPTPENGICLTCKVGPDDGWIKQQLAGVSSSWTEEMKQCAAAILAALPRWTRPLCWIRDFEGDIAIAWNGRHHQCDVIQEPDLDNNPFIVVRVNIRRPGRDDDISFGTQEEAIERLKVGFA
jgi:hypothetical protein